VIQKLAINFIADSFILKMPAAQTWSDRVPNRVEALMEAVRDLEDWLAEQAASMETRYFAQLAVEELGTNIIKYGYDDQNEHQIDIRASWKEPELSIWIEDDGHEFNPWNRPEPDPGLSLEEREPGGWGISLIRRMSAGFDYERKDGRNVVSVLFSKAST